MTVTVLVFLVLANAWNMAAVVLSDQRSVPCWIMCVTNLLLAAIKILSPGVTQ